MFDWSLPTPSRVLPFRMQSSLPVRRYAAALVFLSTPAWASVPSSSTTTPIPACPAARGAYYLKGGSWDALKPVSIKTARASGIRRMLLTYSSKAVAVYLEAKAPVTIGGQPEFCVSGFGSSIKGLTIVKLDQKNNHREMQFVSKRLFRKPKVQYESSDVQPVKLISSDGGYVILATKQRLAPGQYILFPPSRTDSTGDPHGYDFGVK